MTHDSSADLINPADILEVIIKIHQLVTEGRPGCILPFESLYKELPDIDYYFF